MHSPILILIGAQLYPALSPNRRAGLNPNPHAVLLVRCSLKPNPHAAFITTVVHAQPRPNPNRHAALMPMRHAAAVISDPRTAPCFLRTAAQILIATQLSPRVLHAVLSHPNPKRQAALMPIRHTAADPSNPNRRIAPCFRPAALILIHMQRSSAVLHAAVVHPNRRSTVSWGRPLEAGNIRWCTCSAWLVRAIDCRPAPNAEVRRMQRCGECRVCIHRSNHVQCIASTQQRDTS